MTEERLHEIDQHIADGGGDCNGHTERALVDLVAEVRSLRAERDALRTRAEVAEGQRDQAKMRVEAVVQEFYGQSMTEDEGFIAPDFFAMAREILNLRAERDALLVINGDLDRDGKLLEAERDALRTVDNAMVERFLRAYAEYESKRQDTFTHRLGIRAALTAALSALEVQP
jgi:hypothetical protein